MSWERAHEYKFQFTARLLSRAGDRCAVPALESRCIDRAEQTDRKGRQTMKHAKPQLGLSVAFAAVLCALTFLSTSAATGSATAATDSGHDAVFPSFRLPQSERATSGGPLSAMRIALARRDRDRGIVRQPVCIRAGELCRQSSQCCGNRICRYNPADAWHPNDPRGTKRCW